MANFTLNINGKQQQVDVDPSTPMLWMLRDHLNLVGTKYGCGIAQCGACTIGEPPFPPTFGALANALYKATGKRVYRQPFLGENHNI